MVLICRTHTLHFALFPLPCFLFCRFQHVLQDERRLLLALQLGMAVGTLQKAGIRMAQQVSRHLFAGIVLQQVGGEEMPQGVQMILCGEVVLLVKPAKPPG